MRLINCTRSDSLAHLLRIRRRATAAHEIAYLTLPHPRGTPNPTPTTRPKASRRAALRWTTLAPCCSLLRSRNIRLAIVCRRRIRRHINLEPYPTSHKVPTIVNPYARRAVASQSKAQALTPHASASHEPELPIVTLLASQASFCSPASAAYPTCGLAVHCYLSSFSNRQPPLFYRILHRYTAAASCASIPNPLARAPARKYEPAHPQRRRLWF